MKQTHAGAWRCSVNREDVRPFWKRAILGYGVAAVIFYLLATVTAFGFLRTVGYRVTYSGVAWPPAWSKFTVIRTDFFLRKYEAASQSGDMQTALMALATAYTLQPQNYPVGLQLAQLWQIGQPALSNQIYRRLLDEHPSEAEGTAQAWFRALLARGDFARIEALASERILAAPDRAAAWLNAFLFANRRTGDASARSRLAETPASPLAARFLISLTNKLAHGTSSERAREHLLTAAAEAPDGVSFFNVCRELITRGFAQDALDWIDQRPRLISSRDLAPLRLDALATLGWTTTLHNEVKSLITGRPHSVMIELLSAHLIRHPNADVRNLVFARLEQEPLPATISSYSAYLSLFCAAGAGRDVPRLHWAAARIKEVLRENFRSLDAVGESLLDGNRNRRIENYLPALQPLPLEVSYALFEHYDPIPQ